MLTSFRRSAAPRTGHRTGQHTGQHTDHRTDQRTSQRGAAIVTALLVVTLTTLIVSGLFWRTNVTVRSVENRLALAQTHWVERGVIDWARVVLQIDGATTRSDDLGETWANPVLDTKLDETVTGGARIGDASRSAVLAGQIYDAQARFNLNNLIEDTDGKMLQSLERLFELAGQPTSMASVLRARVQQSYTRAIDGKLIPATALPLLKVADLRYVPGFTDNVIRAIEPYVIFLPLPVNLPGDGGASGQVFQKTAVNVNTAEPVVLAALLPELGLDGARRFVSQVRRQYATLDQATAAMGHEMSVPAGVLSVSSAYFLVRGVVRYDRVEDQTDTLLYRSGNRVDIVWQLRS
ncbi:MAG: type II secretion system minor pseudopilin GspK [Burkholderiaceae bacterium]